MVGWCGCGLISCMQKTVKAWPRKDTRNLGSRTSPDSIRSGFSSPEAASQTTIDDKGTVRPSSSYKKNMYNSRYLHIHVKKKKKRRKNYE